MRIDIRREAGTDICAGANAGRDLFAKLVPALGAEPNEPEALVVDFRGIQVATASFLRESLFALKDFVRGRKSNFYPVVANANGLIIDEVELVLRTRGDAILACEIGHSEKLEKVRLLGHLEGKAEQVFNLVQERGETDAAELQRDFGTSEGVQQTAWNNRLAGLASAGLIAEISLGRSKRYRPLLVGE